MLPRLVIRGVETWESVTRGSFSSPMTSRSKTIYFIFFTCCFHVLVHSSETQLQNMGPRGGHDTTAGEPTERRSHCFCEDFVFLKRCVHRLEPPFCSSVPRKRNCWTVVLPAFCLLKNSLLDLLHVIGGRGCVVFFVYSFSEPHYVTFTLNRFCFFKLDTKPQINCDVGKIDLKRRSVTFSVF